MAKTHNADSAEQAEPAFDLTNVLAAPVKSGNPAPTFSLDPEQEIEPAPYELEEEVEQAQVITEPLPGNQGYSDGEEPKSLSADDLSIIFVNILDGVQKFGLTLARKKVAFSEEELAMIDGLDHSPTTIYPAGTKEAIAKEKWRKHLDAIKTLPFEADEKKRLTDATMIYARTMEVKVSPLQGLLLAYSEVLGTRAINVFSNI